MQNEIQGMNRIDSNTKKIAGISQKISEQAKSLSKQIDFFKI